MISAMCGLGSPLTEASPEGATGQIIAVAFASWQLAIGALLIGLTGAVPLLEDSLKALERRCRQLMTWAPPSSEKHPHEPWRRLLVARRSEAIFLGMRHAVCISISGGYVVGRSAAVSLLMRHAVSPISNRCFEQGNPSAARHAALCAAFGAMDEDGSGGLSPDEVQW